MSSINMDLVKQLREKTQVGMMDCKKALVEANGDMEAAIDILRKKGAAVAAKRAENETNNGRVEAYVSADARTGALVSIACETDFSANTEDMSNFSALVAREAAELGIEDKDALIASKSNIKDTLDELIAKISEKIEISEIAAMKVATNGIVGSYIHPGSSIGVMVELETEKDATGVVNELNTLARDICMHVAVTKPLALNPEDLDQSIIEKERAIAREQLEASGKPANIIDKIIDGKINKYCSDVCLTKQSFIKNEDISVEKLVNDVAKKIDNPTKIKRFVRLSIGR